MFHKSLTRIVHIIYLKLLPMKVPFVRTAINFQYHISGDTTIGHVVYYVIAALFMLDP